MSIRDESGQLQITLGRWEIINSAGTFDEGLGVGMASYLEGPGYFYNNHKWSSENDHAEDTKDPENLANAALIAEAGTVTNETGLTPRELKEKCDWYEKALAELATLGNGECLGNSDGNLKAQQALGIFKADLEVAYNQLAKAKGEQ